MNDADKLISLGMPHELAKRVADLGGGGEVDELRQEVNDLSVSLAATSSRANEALDKANAAVASIEPPYTAFPSYEAASVADKPFDLQRVSAIVGGLLVEWIRDPLGTCLGDGWSPAGDYAFPEHWGAAGDGVSDDTSAVSSAVNSGKIATGGGGVYRVTSTVVAAAAVEVVNLSILWAGAAESLVMRLNGTGARLIGCRIDGSNIASSGIVDAVGGCEISGCEILNIRSEIGSAIAVQSAGTGGTRIAHNKIHHVHSVGNATTGDINGASRGIQIYSTSNLALPCDIGWNEVWQITGEEGDGIHVLCISGSTFFSSSMTRIHNNTIWDCSKRCIKNQSSDAHIVDNLARLTIAGGYSCIDCIDGANSVIRGNRAMAEVTGARGVQMNGYAPAGVRLSGGQVVDNYVRTFPAEAGIALNVRVVDDVEISGNTLVHGRMTTDTADRLIVSGNRILNMVASGSDGGISLRVTSLSCDVSDNSMSGGDAYTCVRVDGTGCKITGNRNRSIVNNAASACYITGAGNAISGNINAKAVVPVIRYGGSVTEADQVSAVNNVTMA